MRLAAAFVLAATLVAAPGARAQSAPAGGGDVVSLKDGGMLRGTLIEVIPGDHASLQLATGQIAVVRWDAIAKLDRGGAAAPAATAAGVAPVASGAAKVTVHIETDRSVRLERRVKRDWVFVCQAPCDVQVDSGDEYRLAGDMKTSGSFRLAGAPGGRVVLTPSPASGGVFVGGIVIASVGAVVALTGAVLLAASNINYFGVSAGNGDKTPGIVCVASGLGAIVVGTVMIVTNARTGVQQSSPDDPRTRGGRAPTWTDARLEGPTLATPATTTVFAARF